MQAFNRAVLISDLHLCDTRPDLLRAFCAFLEEVAPRYEALFILGDFFEYWVGDDAVTPFHQNIAHRLRELSDQTAIFLMVGNRDFAMGEGFATACGATLLKDTAKVQFGTGQWLLSHGDALCTDDTAYQRYRRIIRNPFVLGSLRRLPRSWRIRLAERLRQNSRNRYQQGRTDIVDVNQEAVVRLLNRENADGLIHGHTHLADWHRHQLPNGKTAERLVLGDWHKDGWYVGFDRDEKELVRFSVVDPIF